MLIYVLKKRCEINMNQIILGIETTCDDTGIGICINDKVVANEIISSMKMHQVYGGVVPEIAARAHEQNLITALENALEVAKLNIEDISHIAYADHPGLPGCLHVGRVFAKSLGLCLNVPIIPINHLYGHLFSGAINSSPVTYPSLGLVVSGGHTSIYLIKSASDIDLLSETADDAIGEVYDKVARVLGLTYPGGPEIDKLYDESLKKSIVFLNNSTQHKAFSYSGFKTAVINYINKTKKTNLDIKAIASSFQHWIINDFLNRVNFFLKQHKVKMIVLGGGVSANSYLRQQIKKINLPVLISEMQYTNDNGAMHAYYASVLLKENSKKDISKLV